MSEERKVYEVPEFDGKNVPVTEAAKIMGKDQQFIRQGLIKGVLPIGLAFKKEIYNRNEYKHEESSQYDYYISPRLLWEYTGYKVEDTKCDDNVK